MKMITKGVRLPADQITALEKITTKENRRNIGKTSFSDLVRIAIDDFIIKYNGLEKDS